MTREHLVRALWTLFEPVHAISYFSREAREEFAADGLDRYWDGYFAGRAAPLGPVGAAPVIAIFGGFSPFLVERALPAVWATVTPELMLEARSRGAARTLRGVFGDEEHVRRAAEALTAIAAKADIVGRPLSAANQALAEYADPYRQLWQASATLREHRGDGHVIAQVAEGVAGLTTIVLRSGLDIEATTMKRARGWTDDQWAAEADRLMARGLLDIHGIATPAGAALLSRVEGLTNRLALEPWSAAGDDELRRIATLLAPVAAACSSVFPHPNPTGMPLPWDPVADPDAASVPIGPVTRAAGS